MGKVRLLICEISFLIWLPMDKNFSLSSTLAPSHKLWSFGIFCLFCFNSIQNIFKFLSQFFFDLVVIYESAHICKNFVVYKIFSIVHF